MKNTSEGKSIVIGELVSESMLRLRSANSDAENLFSMTHDKRRKKCM